MSHMHVARDNKQHFHDQYSGFFLRRHASCPSTATISSMHISVPTFACKCHHDILGKCTGSFPWNLRLQKSTGASNKFGLLQSGPPCEQNNVFSGGSSIATSFQPSTYLQATRRMQNEVCKAMWSRSFLCWHFDVFVHAPITKGCIQRPTAHRTHFSMFFFCLCIQHIWTLQHYHHPRCKRKKGSCPRCLDSCIQSRHWPMLVPRPTKPCHRKGPNPKLHLLIFRPNSRKVAESMQNFIPRLSNQIKKMPQRSILQRTENSCRDDIT